MQKPNTNFQPQETRSTAPTRRGVGTLLLLCIALAAMVACGGSNTPSSSFSSSTNPAAPVSGSGTGTGTTGTSNNGTPAASPVPHSDHVFMIMEENWAYTDVMSNNVMPWLMSQANANGYAANYTSNSAGSMLDYLWLASGSSEESTFGCGGWGCPVPITSDNIFRELTKAGKTWKVYAEDIPNVGYMGGDINNYVNRHNAAVWYSDVINSPAMQQNIVPFTQFAQDMAAGTLPNYSIIVPNVMHDAHDGSLQQADQWLQSNIGPLLQTPIFQPGGNGLLLITWDECGSATNDPCGGHVFTGLIGPNVIPHTVSNTPYMHQHALRTIMDSLGVPVYPGASANVQPMTDFFRH